MSLKNHRFRSVPWPGNARDDRPGTHLSADSQGPIATHRPENGCGSAVDRPILVGMSVKLWLAKSEYADPKTRLGEYLRCAEKADVVLVCHSNRYWTRPYCMFELTTAVYAILDDPSRVPSIVFVPLSDQNALTDTERVLLPCIKRWRESDSAKAGVSISADLIEPTMAPAFRQRVATFLEFDLRRKLQTDGCLLYTSPSPRDRQKSRMPSSA